MLLHRVVKIYIVPHTCIMYNVLRMIHMHASPSEANIYSHTRMTVPSFFSSLASVNAMFASVAEVNHLYPWSLYEPSGSGP